MLELILIIVFLIGYVLPIFVLREIHEKKNLFDDENYIIAFVPFVNFVGMFVELYYLLNNKHRYLYEWFMKNNKDKEV